MTIKIGFRSHSIVLFDMHNKIIKHRNSSTTPKGVISMESRMQHSKLQQANTTTEIASNCDNQLEVFIAKMDNPLTEMPTKQMQLNGLHKKTILNFKSTFITRLLS